MLPANIEMKLESNNLSGTVPPSWAHFSPAKINLWNKPLIMLMLRQQLLSQLSNVVERQ
jgi:hypothetical protein